MAPFIETGLFQTRLCSDLYTQVGERRPACVYRSTYEGGRLTSRLCKGFTEVGQDAWARRLIALTGRTLPASEHKMEAPW